MTPLCPHCQAPRVRHLEASSRDAEVDYFRCEQCGRVWNVPKNAPMAPPRSVTIDPENA